MKPIVTPRSVASGNYRLALSLIRAVKAKNVFERVLIGTDTPGGTGVIPRGILREIALYRPSAKSRRKRPFVWRRETSAARMI